MSVGPRWHWVRNATEFRWRVLFQLLAAGNLANGAWMLVAPLHWYNNLPGRVVDFGPMNEHFIRDLGCVFAMLGFVALKGAYDSAWRKSALLILQLWFVPHACIHLFDTFRGLVAIEHLYMDMPLCYAPPLLVGILQRSLRAERRAAVRPV